MDLVGVVIALFLGVNLLSKELDKKTVYAVLPKPLPRWEFVVGKFLGLSGVMAALIVAMSGVLNLFVLAVGGNVTEVLLRAEFLVMFEMLLVIAVAMFFASFSSPYLSAMFTAGVWMIGRGSGELEALATGRLADSPARFIIEGLLAVVPDFSMYFVSGAAVESVRVSIHEAFVPWVFVLSMLGYTVLYSFAALAFASALFQRRDLT
jgi:ABC-type transport system involved in multi-copper enzyme maturation permease subunit